MERKHTCIFCRTNRPKEELLTYKQTNRILTYCKNAKTCRQTSKEKEQYAKETPCINCNKQPKSQQEIQIIILSTKKRIAEEENKAFKEQLISEKQIRNNKIQTIIDNLEVFDIKDDQGNTITNRTQLETKNTEWLIKTADESDHQLAQIVGETQENGKRTA